MIVLDTNVLSETLRQSPDPQVLRWLESGTEMTTLTAISAAELLTGVRLLPAGKRRTGLLRAIEEVLTQLSRTVLPFDEPAARIYAKLQAKRRTAGKPLSVEDGMIAAICLHREFPLATRNTKDFQGLGLELINPWETQA
ncbi:MAG: type II toxin-antitoxin system VapC family toxin [Renibacterium sp.]|nr:type II toxin-antitoxin system VapC family toxin [Renibacterium sp.]